MRSGNFVYSALTSAVFLAGVFPSAAISGGNCPPIKLDQKTFATALTVNEESVSFSYRSKLYPLDIFSAFTKGSSAASNICIRYEAVSKAQDTIEKFYWPLAGIQMDMLSPNQRVSLANTKPPGRDPTIDETWIYAFLNAAVRTSAFQRRTEYQPPNIVRIALSQDGDRKQKAEATKSSMQLAALDTFEQRLQLKEPTKFFEVGSQFSSGEKDEISSTFEASWDGENTRIQMKLERSNEKTIVFAPITYALAKASNSSDFLALILDFTRKAQPLLPLGKENSFEFSRKLSPKDYAGSQALYVIEQPISLVTSNGKVCFSSPMYSPMPIPAEFLQCGLF
jgi:hypothetical protein